MPAKVYEHSILSKCISEATGTYFLVLTVGCNVMVMSTGGALSIGSMLMCMIYALGSVSGGHFNPAVSLSIYLSARSKFTGRDLFLYTVSQLIGAVIAGLCYEVIFQDAFVLKPVGKYNVFMVMAVEVIYSMALCYVVLNVATTSSQAGNHYFGLAIGFTVVSAAIAIGGISNCCLNPAVAIGSLLAALLAKGSRALGAYSVYFFMPYLGGIFGALAFYLVRRKDEYEPRNTGLFVIKDDVHSDTSSLAPLSGGVDDGSSGFISPISKTTEASGKPKIVSATSEDEMS
jgi:aquaporin Z